MQPFEGNFLLFVAEAENGALREIQQGAAKQSLFTTDLSVTAGLSAARPLTG